MEFCVPKKAPGTKNGREMKDWLGEEPKGEKQGQSASTAKKHLANGAQSMGRATLRES